MDFFNRNRTHLINLQKILASRTKIIVRGEKEPKVSIVTLIQDL